MEQVVDILHLLSNEKKGKDEKDESLTSIDKREGDKIKRKYQEDKWKTENELLIEELAGKKQDRDQRKEFANKIFDFMCWYLGAVFFIIMLNGITINNFKVSDDIILALLGTTAVEIIGTFAIVARYLFSKNNKTS